MNKAFKFLFIVIFQLCTAFSVADVTPAAQTPPPQNLQIIGAKNTKMDPEKLQAAIQEALRPKIVCLNMIVKNESPVIERCLKTVKPLINYWVIVDTGSTDGTQDIIKNYMKDIPGELHERPWVNFEHNRNEAYQLAKDKGEYILFIDADEVFKYADNFKWPPLNRDYYFIDTHFGGTRYNRMALVKSKLDWKWIGVLHEYLHAPEAKIGGKIDSIVNVPTSDGARSRDPEKYRKDAQILEEALKTEPNNERYAYYLAQSYMDGNENEKALKAFEHRIEMGGWPEEVYVSMVNMGHIKWRLGYPDALVLETYRKAYEYRPSRIEAPYYMANYMRIRNNEEEAYPILKQALNIPVSNDALFVQSWIYDYGLLFEYSIAAYWAGQYQESLKTIDELLKKPDLPEIYKEYSLKNKKYAQEKLRELAPHPPYKAKAA